MSDIKNLLNGPQNFIYDAIRIYEERTKYLGELLKVLSDNSREIKSELQQIKKDACDVTDWRESRFDYDARIFRLLEKSHEAVITMKTVEIIDALQSMWNWDSEAISTFIALDYHDDFLKNMTKRFTSYADSFRSLYLSLATEYLRKNRKIPDYKVILKKAFCKQMKRYMEPYIKNMKFDEDEFKESFPEIQEQLKEYGIDLEPSDNIQESFIKLCREKYPLAKKNCDFLFNQKNFKKKFLEDFISELDMNLWNEFDRTMGYCREDISNSWEKTEDDAKVMEFINVPIYTIDAMNEIMDKRVWEEWVIALYFTIIADAFEKEHNKKLKNAADKIKKDSEKRKPKEEALFSGTTKLSWRNSLSEEENYLIREAVSYLNHKDEQSIIKYITKLKVNDRPLKFHELKTLFDIKEIPPITERILIDQLWLEYEVEEEVLKVLEEEKKEQEEKKEKAIVQKEIQIDNPKQYLLDKMNELWYIIDNEAAIRKQLDEFLQNENYTTILKNLLKKPEFLRVFLHKWGHSAARVIRIWMTWRRMLFEKKDDDKFHLLYIANHNNYENRLAMVKNRRKG